MQQPLLQNQRQRLKKPKAQQKLAQQAQRGLQAASARMLRTQQPPSAKSSTHARHDGEQARQRVRREKAVGASGEAASEPKEMGNP